MWIGFNGVKDDVRFKHTHTRAQRLLVCILLLSHDTLYEMPSLNSTRIIKYFYVLGVVVQPVD